MSDMTELVGKTILKVIIDKDAQEYLAFETDQGRIIYVAYGDCCSTSWFADITGFDALAGHRVLEVESVYLDCDNSRTRQEEDKAYGFNFKTTGGHASIAFRNSSNGYYGGWLELIDGLPTDASMIEVTDDYSA